VATEHREKQQQNMEHHHLGQAKNMNSVDPLNKCCLGYKQQHRMLKMWHKLLQLVVNPSPAVTQKLFAAAGLSLQ
jgi:hypothetical protein